MLEKGDRSTSLPQAMFEIMFIKMCVVIFYIFDLFVTCFGDKKYYNIVVL